MHRWVEDQIVIFKELFAITKEKGVIRRTLAEWINPPPSSFFHAYTHLLLSRKTTFLYPRLSQHVIPHSSYNFCPSPGIRMEVKTYLSGYFSPGSRPRWKMIGCSVCSFWSWVVTPGTSWPGQKFIPCERRQTRKIFLTMSELYNTFSVRVPFLAVKVFTQMLSYLY